jgi:hypothetical protein
MQSLDECDSLTSCISSPLLSMWHSRAWEPLLNTPLSNFLHQDEEFKEACSTIHQFIAKSVKSQVFTATSQSTIKYIATSHVGVYIQNLGIPGLCIVKSLPISLHWQYIDFPHVWLRLSRFWLLRISSRPIMAGIFEVFRQIDRMARDMLRLVRMGKLWLGVYYGCWLMTAGASVQSGRHGCARY